MKGRTAAVYLMVFGLLDDVAVIAADLFLVAKPFVHAAAYGGVLCFAIGWLLSGAALTNARSSRYGAAAAVFLYLVIGFVCSQVAGPLGYVAWPMYLAGLLVLDINGFTY